jgi:hypothetical protein
VWEINTNPMISVAPHKLAAGRLVAQQAFMKQLNSAWEAVDLKHAGDAAAPAELRVSRALARRLNVGPLRRAQRLAARTARWLSQRQFVREFS